MGGETLVRQITEECYRVLINFGAAGVILFHNHPSGDPSPSAEDLAYTRRVIDAGKVLDVNVVDHLIIGRQRYYSFRDHGHL